MEGEIRLTNSSTGGPVFVYVKDGKIVRITPMDFDETDPKAGKSKQEVECSKHLDTQQSHHLQLVRNQ